MGRTSEAPTVQSDRRGNLEIRPFIMIVIPPPPPVCVCVCVCVCLCQQSNLLISSHFFDLCYNAFPWLDAYFSSIAAITPSISSLPALSCCCVVKEGSTRGIRTQHPCLSGTVPYRLGYRGSHTHTHTHTHTRAHLLLATHTWGVLI